MMMCIKSREEVEGERVSMSFTWTMILRSNVVAGSSEISRSVRRREITGIEYVQVPLHSRGRRMTDGANEIKDIELRDGQIEARNDDGVK